MTARVKPESPARRRTNALWIRQQLESLRDAFCDRQTADRLDLILSGKPWRGGE